MNDLETFLTTLYVIADDFCQSQMQPEEKPFVGRPRSLQCSEVIVLALFGQWAQFQSERAFYRYAEQHLRAAFPDLSDRGQFNRLMRAHLLSVNCPTASSNIAVIISLSSYKVNQVYYCLNLFSIYAT
jgi:hypothetical protein